MADTPTDPVVIDEPLSRALGERYLQYALSTITHRALPDVRDGLKPVHRRLLFAMRALRLGADSPFKKSARVVGDVIGKFHPHGEQAVYDALVRLAQDFSSRYPLVDGQGNFGNVDGDNAAAQRYTEARLTALSVALMEGIDEDTVDFRATYDGSENEPDVLPAAIPNLLANGSTGIAVGMATNIPPHNLGELCDALLALLDAPDLDDAALSAIVPGPDFPGGGVIVEPAEAMAETYRTGRGGFRLRANWVREDLGRGQYQIVIDEIPYLVQKSKLYAKIADLITTKKVPVLADVRDESAEDIRLVLEPRSRGVDPEALMETLFRLTDLETRFSLNMNVLDARRVPGVMSLKQVLVAYLDHRRDVLLRRSAYRLERIAARLSVVEAFIIAYLNLDRVIEIIRNEDEPKPIMMAEFQLRDEQAEAILNMRLRSLRKLEELELRNERDALMKEREGLEQLVGDMAAQTAKLVEEVRATRDRFGAPEGYVGLREAGAIAALRRRDGAAYPPGARRTGFADVPEAVALTAEAMIDREPITVICSEQTFIRAMKGHVALDAEVKYKAGDGPRFMLHAETTDRLLAVSASGRVFTLAGDKLPGGRSMGEPLRLSIDLAQDDAIVALFVHRPGGRRIVASNDGRGFTVTEDAMVAQTRAGRQVMTPGSDARLVLCAPVTGDHVAVAGENRKLLVFALEELPDLARGKGVILQRYKDGGLSDLKTFTLDEGLSWRDPAGRTRTVTDLGEWLGKRGGSGRMAPRGFPRDNRFT